MAIEAIEAFALGLAGPGRLIGLDLGTKTIGIALSDVERRIASPLETLARGKFGADGAKLLALCAQHGILAVVLGLPLNMDGTEGPRAQATRAFARNLAALPCPPVIYWDERLSTAAVTRTMIEQDMSRQKRAAAVDKMAAAYILQGALDRLRRLADA